MKKVYCLKCGLISKYEIVKSPSSGDDSNFKYSRCECGSQQPICLGNGCIDVVELSCPQNEHDASNKIITAINNE